MSISLLPTLILQKLLYTVVAGVAIFGMEKQKIKYTLLVPPTKKIRQYSITRYIRCEFHIKIVHPINNKEMLR